jgi:hypothetical protein
VSVGESIVANNTGNNCFGGISDRGYNLESTTDCGFTGTGDLQNTDPKLDPNGLQNNGGSTQTIALQQGSPAIDWVASGCPSTDQRGNARPDGTSESKCDIGAYESSYTPVLTVSVKSVSATEGSAFSGVVATGTASGTNTLSATLSWGDGSSSAGSVSLNPDGSYSVTGSHTYAEEGSSFALTVQVSASGGQSSASGTGVVTVADAALAANTPTAVINRRAVTLKTTFTDADPNGTVSDYTASINWGDGTTSAAIIGTNPSGSGFTAVKSHKYGRHGTYTVKVTIKDAGGSSITKTLKITV